MHHRPRPGRGSPKPWSSLPMTTDQAPGNESDGRQISRTSARPRSPVNTANTIPLASQCNATMSFAHGINPSSPYLGRPSDAQISRLRSVVWPLLQHYEADALPFCETTATDADQSAEGARHYCMNQPWLTT